MWSAAAAILKTGQIDFVDNEGSVDDSCRFADPAIAQDLADTLGVSLESLENGLTTKHVVTVGETFHKPLNAAFARMNRDVLAQNMYDNLFSWLIDELNALRRDKRMLESKVSELTVEMQTMRGGGGGKPTRGGDSPSLSQSVASQRRSLAGSQRTESPAPATSSAGRPGTQSGMGSRLRGSQRSEQIWSERAKVQGLLEQLDENSREIEGQRYEIKRLHLLAQQRAHPHRPRLWAVAVGEDGDALEHGSCRPH